MKIVKNITDTITEYMDIYNKLSIVEDSYMLQETEEFILNPYYAEQLYYGDKFDYIQFRLYLNECKSVWNDLSNGDKFIMLRHYRFISESNWSELNINADTKKSFWKAMLDEERNCRKARYRSALAEVGLVIENPIDRLSIYMDTIELANQWIDVESPAFICFITDSAIEGICNYTETGISSKSYYSADSVSKILTELNKF